MNLARVFAEIADVRAEPSDRSDPGTWRDACDHVARALMLTRMDPAERAYWATAYDDLCKRADLDALMRYLEAKRAGLESRKSPLTE